MVQKDKVVILLITFLTVAATILYVVSLKDGTAKNYELWWPPVSELYFKVPQAAPSVFFAAVVLYWKIGPEVVNIVCYSFIASNILSLAYFILVELGIAFMYCNNYDRIEYVPYNDMISRIGGYPSHPFCMNRHYPVEIAPDRAWWGFMFACCLNLVSAILGLVI